MPRFLVKQFETKIRQFDVTADDRGKAIAKVLDEDDDIGEGFETDFREVNYDVGLSTDEINDQEGLLEELEAAKVEVEEWGLPSISDVELIPEDPT